ncbi:MAG TPA: MerR family transcriptional regulator [Methylomirabilota bacterium]|nr:MerR family transcriptional regulator [Methylomirabilota bacterium]
MEPYHSIEMASRLTGLSQNLIRAWELRYRAVTPQRTATKRRVYSPAEIERLLCLKKLTEAGHSIGRIAHLPENQLRELAANERMGVGGAIAPAVSGATLADKALDAIRTLNGPALEAAMKRGLTAWGGMGVLQRMIAPLAHQIGEKWRAGDITAAHEHFATAIIRRFLGEMEKSFSGADLAPGIVVATPTGQLHELGAMMAAAMAASLGWNVTLLGASLPAAEIAGAATQKRAKAVALSLVYPEDDPTLPQELLRLRQLMPGEIAIIAGGRATPSYRGALNMIGALAVDNLAEFGEALDELRRR